MRFDELTHEPRLSDTGLADESDDLPVTRRGAIDQALKLSKLGLENDNDVFVPMDEPHEVIQAVVRRD